MNRMACVGAVALAVGGCSPLSALTGPPGGGNAEVLRMISEHANGCDRHYQGGLGVGASFTFMIDCKAQRSPEEGISSGAAGTP